MRSRPSHALALSDIRRVALPILHKAGAENVRIFGSFARGEQRRTSDLDLLLQLPEAASLLDMVALKQELEAALGRSVDVLTEEGLSPHLRAVILQECRPL